MVLDEVDMKTLLVVGEYAGRVSSSLMNSTVDDLWITIRRVPLK